MSVAYFVSQPIGLRVSATRLTTTPNSVEPRGGRISSVESWPTVAVHNTASVRRQNFPSIPKCNGPVILLGLTSDCPSWCKGRAEALSTLLWTGWPDTALVVQVSPQSR